MRQAYRPLEADILDGNGWLVGARPPQADVDTAVAWAFTHHALSGFAPDAIPAAAGHPRLAAMSARAEARPAFRAAPTG